MTSKCLMEVVLEIERDDCLVVDALSGHDCSIERLSVRIDKTLHAIQPKNGCDVGELLTTQCIKTRTTKKGAVWAESSSCSACSFFSRMSFVDIIGSATVGRKRLQARLIVPSRSDLRLLRYHLKNSGLDYEIISEKPFVHKEMTDKEKNILDIALRRNYFDCENRMSLTDLAESLGVSPSSLSELIRRATKKAVVFYLERKAENIPV